MLHLYQHCQFQFGDVGGGSVLLVPQNCDLPKNTIMIKINLKCVVDISHTKKLFVTYNLHPPIHPLSRPRYVATRPPNYKKKNEFTILIIIHSGN